MKHHNVVLDNRATAMTGHQDNPGTGYTAERSTMSLDMKLG